MPGPMQGVKVVEIAIWVAGPAGGGILADWGADVIKIESPTGDPLRAIQQVLGPQATSNPFFEPDNRGKRSVVLDLRQAEDRQVALELLDEADVFVTNLRLAALARLGFDSDTLLARNPRLIYALVTGYGLIGPDAATGAYDLGAFWARGGVADILSVPGEDPPIQRSGMGDHTAGLAIAAGVSAALYHRERTGEGQLITTALNRIAAFHISSDLSFRLMNDMEPPHYQRRTQDNPLWNNYLAADGKRFWLIGVEAERHWPTLLRIIERPDLGADERYASQALRAANKLSLIPELDSVFATRSRAEWGERFDAEKDFFWAPVNTVDEVIADPQTEASGAFVTTQDGSLDKRMVATPVDFHGTPWSVRTRAPRLGEHTDEVRAELSSRRR